MTDGSPQEASSKLKRAWPRSARQCAYSKQPLVDLPFYYSALIEKQEQWVRYDLAPEHFQGWRDQQKDPVVAWWKVAPVVKDKSANTFSERALEAMEHLASDRGLIPSMAFEERVLLMALTLQRRKLAHVEFFPQGGAHIQVDSLELSLDLQFVTAGYMVTKGQQIRKHLEQLQAALEQG